jgi:hypothetical protein
MTRRRLSRTLTFTFLFLGTVLLIAAAARFAYPRFTPDSTEHHLLLATYDYLKDMSLLIATGGVAYLSNVYQKRSSFIEALRQEWNEIIRAKSAVFAFTHLEAPTHAQFVDTFCAVSETIDNMRVVYRNVGETDGKIGLYPYAPLHDIRRALQTIDPRKRPNASADERKLVRDAMLQAFYALRETFLEELDLDEPTYPLLIAAGRRSKVSGSTGSARGQQLRQGRHRDAQPNANPEIDALLTELYLREQAKQGAEPGTPLLP